MLFTGPWAWNRCSRRPRHGCAPSRVRPQPSLAPSAPTRPVPGAPPRTPLLKRRRGWMLPPHSKGGPEGGAPGAPPRTPLLNRRRGWMLPPHSKGGPEGGAPGAPPRTPLLNRRRGWILPPQSESGPDGLDLAAAVGDAREGPCRYIGCPSLTFGSSSGSPGNSRLIQRRRADVPARPRPPPDRDPRTPAQRTGTAPTHPPRTPPGAGDSARYLQAATRCSIRGRARLEGE